MKTVMEKDKYLEGINRVHMIGIGGSGMYPLAEILHNKGYTVSGSDVLSNDATNRLESLGIKVYLGQSAQNIGDAQLIVYSAAVHEDNVERVAAKENGIKEIERSELLGALTRKYNNVIGVCGTHGKTTVTAMITQILYLNKMQPTSVIGGKLPLVNSYCTIGNSENFVCESCEFQDSFLNFSPDVSVLLNIDDDHMDYFKTMENLENSFKKFVSFSKKCYCLGDNSSALKVAKQSKVKTVTFGFNSDNDYYAANIKSGKRGYCFTVFKGKTELTNIELLVPGKHNILNALAAFAVCFDMGVLAEDIKNAVSDFTGAGRRFEIIGEFSGITVADDYAHHPTEIEATINAARSLPINKLTVVFQPFTYSRVAKHKEGMIKALLLADKVFLTPIVAAREENIYGVSSEQIAAAVGGEVLSDYNELAKRVVSESKAGDMIITVGAGDVYKVGRIIAEMYKK